MARTPIPVGTTPNDGTGIPWRTAWQDVNAMTAELYAAVGVQGLTANSTGAAAANTAAINAALAAGGSVQVTTPGVFYINNTLVMRDNTSITLGANTILRLASGTNLNMIQAQNWLSTKVTCSAFTLVAAPYGQGTAVTLSFTTSAAHGWSTGQWVLFKGDTTKVTDGFHIVTVIDSTHASILISGSMTANAYNWPMPVPAGTITAQLGNYNIGLFGGWFDGNPAGNTSTGDYNSHAIQLNKVGKVVIRDTSVSAQTYAICLTNAHGVEIDNVSFHETARDGVHLQGPCRNVTISNITGGTYDDLIAYTANNEGYTGLNMPAAADMDGEMINLTLRDIRPTYENGRILIAPKLLYECSGILIDGYQPLMNSNAISAIDIVSESASPSAVKDVTIRKMRLSPAAPGIYFTAGPASSATSATLSAAWGGATSAYGVRFIEGAAVTFSGTISANAVSKTLSGNWAKATGTYPITFSSGEVRYVSLTNGSTAASWPVPLISSATANATYDEFRTVTLTNGATTCTWTGGLSNAAGANAYYYNGNYNAIVLGGDVSAVMTVEKLIIEDCYGEGFCGSFLNIGNCAAVGEITLSRCRVRWTPPNGTDGQNFVAISGTGTFTINSLVVDGCSFWDDGVANGNAFVINNFSTATLVNKFLVRNTELGTWFSVGQSTTAANVPLIEFDNCTVNGGAALVATASSCSIKATNCRIISALQGPFNLYGSVTYTVQCSGLSHSSTDIFTNKGTTLILKGGDSTVVTDMGLVSTTSTGAIGYHSSAVAGRNAANQQGLAVCANSHWYALATGAAGVNTLIV